MRERFCLCEIICKFITMNTFRTFNVRTFILLFLCFVASRNNALAQSDNTKKDTFIFWGNKFQVHTIQVVDSDLILNPITGSEVHKAVRRSRSIPSTLNGKRIYHISDMQSLSAITDNNIHSMLEKCLLNILINDLMDIL